MAIWGRLLTPHDFGIFGIITATRAVFIALEDMGLKSVFIKADNVTSESSNAFYTFNILLGGIVSIILLLSSPLLSTMYDEESLIYLMPVYAVITFIGALSRQGYAQLTRQLEFKKVMIIDTISLFLATFLGVLAAYFDLAIWSLLIYLGTEYILRLIGIKIFVKHSYHITNIAVLKKYLSDLRFGFELTISRIFKGMTQTVTKLVFGKLFSINILGEFERALALAIKPDDTIRVALTTPALAHIARKETRIGDYYIIILNVILLAAGIPCFIFILVGDLFLPLFMGAQWISAGVYLQILGIFGFSKVIQGVQTVILINEKDSRFLIKLEAIGASISILFPVSFYLFINSTIFFIINFSIISLIYWLVSLLYSIKRMNMIDDVFFVFFRLLLPIVVSIGLVFFIKKLIISLIEAHAFIQIIIIIIIFIIIILILEIIINYSIMKKVISVIKK